MKINIANEGHSVLHTVIHLRRVQHPLCGILGRLERIWIMMKHQTKPKWGTVFKKPNKTMLVCILQKHQCNEEKEGLWQLRLSRQHGNAGDAGSIPGWKTSPGVGNGNPLHYYCLENSVDKRSLAGYSSWSHKELDMTKHYMTTECKNNHGLKEQYFINGVKLGKPTLETHTVDFYIKVLYQC